MVDLYLLGKAATILYAFLDIVSATKEKNKKRILFDLFAIYIFIKL